MVEDKQLKNRIIKSTLEYILNKKIEDMIHAKDIMRDRIKRTDLREHGVITPDFFLFELENNIVNVYFGSKEYNLILQNITEAEVEIDETGFYKPRYDDISRTKYLVRRGMIKKYPHSEFNLKKTLENGMCCFEIRGDNKTQAQKELTKLIYGGRDEKETREIDLMMRGRYNGDKTLSPRILMPTEEYIRDIAKTGPVTRLPFLYSRFYDYDFRI